nr:MAG TPA: hypothetical protein [Bacteriophage sp.]
MFYISDKRRYLILNICIYCLFRTLTNTFNRIKYCC